jgi:heat shock protein beta-11
MSVDLCSESVGASVYAATSHDNRYPPSTIIDGRSNTFWVSTGMFPQEFVVQFSELSTVRSIDLVTTGIRDFEVYKSDGPHASSWEKITSSQANDSDGEIQRLSLHVPPRLITTFLRFKVSIDRV